MNDQANTNRGQADINYDFVAPGRIIFGWGRRAEVGVLAAGLGHRVFLAHGLPAATADPVLAEIQRSLDAAEVSLEVVQSIDHEPEVADVDRFVDRLRQETAGPGDVLLAIGGGAAIDLAKAAAALVINDDGESVCDYLEGVGRGLKLTEQPLPLLAMPTTAGTGAEATHNAVISSYDPAFKKSLRDPRMVPDVALIDPELTVSVPPEVTAASGMDAITQLIESYVSPLSRPIPRALCLQGLRLAVPALPVAVEQPDDRSAREAMSHAALLSGLALANAKLGMAHGVAPALGTHARVPHGLACALMLPTALKVNREESEAELARLAHVIYGESARQSPGESVDRLISEIEALRDRIGLPSRLSEVGVTREQLPAIVRDSFGSSMRGNPVQLDEARLQSLLEELL